MGDKIRCFWTSLIYMQVLLGRMNLLRFPGINRHLSRISMAYNIFMILSYGYIAIVVSLPRKSYPSFYCQLIYITAISGKWMTVAYSIILFYNSIANSKLARLLHKMDAYQKYTLSFDTQGHQFPMKMKVCALLTSGVASLAVIGFGLDTAYRKFSPNMDAIAQQADERFPVPSGPTAIVTYFVYIIELVLHQYSTWCLILLFLCSIYWILRELHKLQRYEIVLLNWIKFIWLCLLLTTVLMGIYLKLDVGDTIVISVDRSKYSDIITKNEAPYHTFCVSYNP